MNEEERSKAKEKRNIILEIIQNLSNENILKGGEFTFQFRGKPGIVTFSNSHPPGPPPPPPPPPDD